MTNYQQEEDCREYTVLKNGEDQFSIWLAYKDVPAGWEDVGKKGSKAECLEYISETWTDMTPRSVRKSQQKSQQTNVKTESQAAREINGKIQKKTAGKRTSSKNKKNVEVESADS